MRILGFQKESAVRSPVCRIILNRSALESPDLGASSGGSNLSIRTFGADLGTFEIAGFPQHFRLHGMSGKPATSKAVMSAAKGRMNKFDPQIEAPELRLPSALRISTTRQTFDRISTFMNIVQKLAPAKHVAFLSHEVIQNARPYRTSTY